MSTPAQGAVGAETRTAGLTLTFDPSKLFDVVAQVGDSGKTLGRRIVGIMLTSGQSSFREDLGLAFYGVTATPAPRTDGGMTAGEILTAACKPWEHYTGEPPDDGSPLSGVFVAGMVYTERLLAKLLDVTHYEGGDGSEDFDADATQTLRNILTGARLWDADENRPVSATPAQPAGAVPDSLREAFEAAELHECWVNGDTADVMTNPYGHCGNFDQIVARCATGDLWRKRAVAIAMSLNFVREQIATHPAGQSTGQGAETGGSVEVIERCVKLAKDAGLDSVTITGSVRHWQDIIAKLREPAPDSPLTGPVGVNDGFDASISAVMDRYPKILDYLARHEVSSSDIARTHIGPDTVAVPLEPTAEMLNAPLPVGSSITGARYESRRDLRPLIYAAMIAARPAAPEAQGAWCFDMEAAPRDGTMILVTRQTEAGTRYVEISAWRKDTYGNWFWGLNGDFQRSWSPAVAWKPLDKPAPSSGQGGR